MYSVLRLIGTVSLKVFDLLPMSRCINPVIQVNHLSGSDDTVTAAWELYEDCSI